MNKITVYLIIAIVIISIVPQKASIISKQNFATRTKTIINRTYKIVFTIISNFLLGASITHLLLISITQNPKLCYSFLENK